MHESLDSKFAALADPTRRAIIARLALGEATVAELRAPFAMSQPAISKHLKVLEKAGLIDAGRAAQSRPRRLNTAALREATEWISFVGQLWSDNFDRLDAFLAANPEKNHNRGEIVMASDAPAQTATEFVIARHFAASPERLWEAWTDPAQMAQWLGPKGTTGTTLAADVRPGGLLHWRMDGAEGSMWGRAVYREVIAPSRLVYVQSFSDAEGGIARAPFFEGRWPLEMLTIVTFEPDDKGTQVTLTWRPLDAAADELANFVSNIPSMHGGWGNSFDQLAALVGQG